ncbi:YgaP family membrane protein [Natronolimnohabitans innermongolicus]|uniref:Inner membrane protein YgaP-like transmembrane domain-containing protein n=1 Tax=Natronolimnohabitans innermongolicus JCM 12255 TaxID=1227499 RepID=L9WST1_9EURY|nr:DUF2892 domain-containing protein [Natronolimnohabitans innermongolicus]ELY52490.1 hypothetical protein C493_15615 [Natronolimnohabitans innermongolicus JCM 12255]
MQRNVGGIDRIVRGVLGIWLLVVAAAAIQQRAYQRAVIAAIAGAGLLQNVATGFCGGNFLFGLDTTATEPDAPSETDDVSTSD